jgi:hypothetical protein
MSPESIPENMKVVAVVDRNLIKQLEKAKNRRRQNGEENWHIWRYWFFITRALAPANSRVFLPGELYRQEKREEFVDIIGRWSTENVAEKYGSIFDKFGGHHEYIERMVAEDTRLHRQLWRRYVQAHSSLVFDGIRRIFS